MNEFTSAFTETGSAVLETPVMRFALWLLPIALIGPTFRMMFELIGSQPDFFGFFVDLWKWLADKVITWLCSTEKGFKLAYNLRWARPGVDFFVCGQDCDKCPDCGKCNNEARVAGDVVIQSQDPGAGSNE